MYHLIFWRKHELNAVNLTSTYSFPFWESGPFGFSTLHFRVSEVLVIPGSVIYWILDTASCLML